MILSGLEIKKRLNKDIIIEPFDEKAINPNSYNMKLHNELLIYEEEVLDMKKPNKTKQITIPRDGLLLEPGTLYLGRTVEYTETQNLVPMLEGRSSIGRLGLYIHVTAGFGDVGFKGYWTLEIHCVQPIKIYPHVEICQAYFHTIEGDFINYSSGKYQNNTDIQPSLLYKDFKNI
jgi:dCTP deaminase